jgi:hypothetical protein
MRGDAGIHYVRMATTSEIGGFHALNDVLLGLAGALALVARYR